MAPWSFDIFQRKMVCFCAKNINHYGFFAALNPPGKLVHGDKTGKLECALASFDSTSSDASPLLRKGFVNYIYFLLNICHALHSWVQDQDENEIESVSYTHLTLPTICSV